MTLIHLITSFYPQLALSRLGITSYAVLKDNFGLSQLSPQISGSNQHIDTLCHISSRTAEFISEGDIEAFCEALSKISCTDNLHHAKLVFASFSVIEATFPSALWAPVTFTWRACDSIHITKSLSSSDLVYNPLMAFQVDPKFLACEPCLRVVISILDGCLTAAWTRTRLQYEDAFVDMSMQCMRRRQELVSQLKRQNQLHPAAIEQQGREFESHLKQNSKQQLTNLRAELLINQEIAVVHALLDALEVIPWMEGQAVCDFIQSRLLAHPEVLEVLVCQNFTDTSLTLLTDKVTCLKESTSHLMQYLDSSDTKVQVKLLKSSYRSCHSI